MITRSARARRCAPGLALLVATCLAHPASSQTASSQTALGQLPTVAPGQMPSSAHRDSGAAFPPSPVGLVTGSGGCGVVGPGCPIPTAGADGAGNVDRPVRSIYADGPAIENPPTWSISALNAATGPVGMSGYAVVDWTIPTVSGAPVFTFQGTDDPALGAGNWFAKACTPSAGGAPSTTGTVAGRYSCANTGEVAVRVVATTCTACTISGVFAAKGGAEAAYGLPLYASPAAYAASRMTADFAGLAINPALMGAPVYSTVAADNAAYGATGLCDYAADQGSSPSSGQHALYFQNVTYGAVHSGTPATKTNPYACANGVLSLTAGYSAPDGWWQGWQFQLSSSNYYQTDGFVARPYGFYYEVSAQMPVGGVVPGFYPWFAPAWMTDALSYYGGQFGSGSLSAPAQGYNEFDGPEFGTLNSPGATSIDGYHYLITDHDWPSVNGGGLAQPNQIQTTRYSASSLLYKNIYDGNYHLYGILVTKNYMIAFVDRIEVARRIKPDQKESLGNWNLKSSISFSNLPIAITTTNILTRVNYIKVWYCTMPNYCSYPVN